MLVEEASARAVTAWKRTTDSSRVVMASDRNMVVATSRFEWGSHKAQSGTYHYNLPKSLESWL
jgi:hypothetical protein